MGAKKGFMVNYRRENHFLLNTESFFGGSLNAQMLSMHIKTISLINTSKRFLGFPMQKRFAFLHFKHLEKSL